MQLFPIQPARQQDAADLPGEIVLGSKGEGVTDDGSRYEGGNRVDPEQQRQPDDAYGMQGKGGGDGNGGPQG